MTIIKWETTHDWCDCDDITDHFSDEELITIENYIFDKYFNRYNPLGLNARYSCIIYIEYYYSFDVWDAFGNYKTIDVPWILLNKKIYTLILCAHKFDKGSTLGVLPNDMIWEILHWL